HCFVFFFCQAEDGIRDRNVTGVQTCALPISDQWATKPSGWPWLGRSRIQLRPKISGLPRIPSFHTSLSGDPIPAGLPEDIERSWGIFFSKFLVHLLARHCFRRSFLECFQAAAGFPGPRLLDVWVRRV